jgi:hypothetical protein
MHIKFYQGPDDNELSFVSLEKIRQHDIYRSYAKSCPQISEQEILDIMIEDGYLAGIKEI